MRLNPDCVRDILLTVEETTDFENILDIGGEQNELMKYPHLQEYQFNEVAYHVNQCKLSGLLTGVTFYSDGFLIMDLSPEGHEFLANIRQENNWNKTKEIAGKVGSVSLNALCQIAGAVISNIINANL